MSLGVVGLAGENKELRKEGLDLVGEVLQRLGLWEAQMDIFVRRDLNMGCSRDLTI